MEHRCITNVRLKPTGTNTTTYVDHHGHRITKVPMNAGATFEVCYEDNDGVIKYGDIEVWALVVEKGVEKIRVMEPGQEVYFYPPGLALGHRFLLPDRHGHRFTFVPTRYAGATFLLPPPLPPLPPLPPPLPRGAAPILV